MSTGSRSWVESAWEVWIDRASVLLGHPVPPNDVGDFYSAWQHGAAPAEAVGTWDAQRWAHQVVTIRDVAEHSGLSIDQIREVLPADRYDGADVVRAMIARSLLDQGAVSALVRATVSGIGVTKLRHVLHRLHQNSWSGACPPIPLGSTSVGVGNR